MKNSFALIASAALFSFACAVYAGSDDGINDGQATKQTSTTQQAAAPSSSRAATDRSNPPKETNYRFLGGHA